MSQGLTSSQIRKVGKDLRKESLNKLIANETLLRLQDIRVSYKEALSEVFQILANESKKVRKSRVVTYRIKRIESIISKLHRYPQMQLNTMVDIAGCRCIVDSEQDIYNIAEVLKNKLNIFDDRDYIITKSPDGYSALHLFVKCSINDSKPIEIQLRTRSQHNWATFVEIIDLLLGMKIKEGQQHAELENFFILLSKVNQLDLREKLELLRIEKKYQIYSKLSTVFNQNYIQVRKLWLRLEEKTDHNFFIIEVDQSRKPIIESFKDFELAEDTYFKKFNNDKTNIVLTHLEKPSYKLISIAYSNYILSMHQFQEVLCKIAQETIVELVQDRKLIKAKEISQLYRTYANQEMTNFKEEIVEMRESTPKNLTDSKLEEWMEDMNERVLKRTTILADSTIDVGLFDHVAFLIARSIKKVFAKSE